MFKIGSWEWVESRSFRMFENYFILIYLAFKNVIECKEKNVGYLSLH